MADAASIMQLAAIPVLICFSGLFSGLTLGLLGLDIQGLDIVASSSEDPGLQSCARKIQPIREDGNLLLCTLLLGNVAVNALLSILLADLTSGLVGFLSSTILIVIFGEIIPQASCSRYALQIGAKAVPVVRVLIWVFFIAAKPIAMALDYALGEEVGTIHSRKELMRLLAIHVKHGAVDVEAGHVVTGALNYSNMLVKDVITEMDDVFMLNVAQKLDFQTISTIFKSGFSRIPVYENDRQDIIGLLLTKDLIFIEPSDETPIRNFVQIFGRGLETVWYDQTLGEVLKVFKKGKAHMALVRTVDDSGPGDPVYVNMGIITLEDIIEEILGDDIVDETDAFKGSRRSGVSGNGAESGGEDDDEDAAGIPAEHRTFDYARLRLLDAKLANEQLSAEEVNAVTAHLVTNVEQFKDIMSEHNLTDETLRKVIARCPVLDLDRKSTEPMSPSTEDWLYTRGKISTSCTLVLTGKLTILAGKDRFRSDAGPWTVVGADALLVEEGQYKPDFSAYVLSDHVRCVRIDNAMLSEELNPEEEGNLLRIRRKRRQRSTTRRRRRARSGASRGGGTDSEAGSNAGDEDGVYLMSDADEADGIQPGDPGAGVRWRGGVRGLDRKPDADEPRSSDADEEKGNARRAAEMAEARNTEAGSTGGAVEMGAIAEDGEGARTRASTGGDEADIETDREGGHRERRKQQRQQEEDLQAQALRRLQAQESGAATPSSQTALVTQEQRESNL